MTIVETAAQPCMEMKRTVDEGFEGDILAVELYGSCGNICTIR